MGSTLPKGKSMSYFRVDRGGPGTPASVDSHLPSAENNSYAIFIYFGILGWHILLLHFSHRNVPESLTYQRPSW